MEDNEFHRSHWGHGQMFGPPWAKMQMMQARRGDMRGIILKALQEQPMHGYEIIRHLEEVSHGMWRPSPGSIYPTLQLLEEEDMVEAQEKDGKKTYNLTKDGKKAAKEAETFEPWRHHANIKGHKELRKLISETMQAFRTVTRSNDQELHKQMVAILKITHDQMLELAHMVENKGR